MKVLSLDGLGHTISKIKAWVTDNYLAKTGGTISGNLEVSGTTTFDGNVFMDGSGTPLIIGNKGKIGLRAKGTSVANVGQINISDSWYSGNQWGAQISAYDGVANKYNQIRVSHNGIQYLVYDNATGSETAQQIALVNDIPSIDSLSVTQTVHKHTTTSTGIVTYTVSDFNSSTMALDVYINGLYCIPTTDYTVNGNVVTIVNELEAGQTCVFVVRKVTL